MRVTCEKGRSIGSELNLSRVVNLGMRRSQEEAGALGNFMSDYCQIDFFDSPPFRANRRHLYLLKQSNYTSICLSSARSY